MFPSVLSHSSLDEDVLSRLAHVNHRLEQHYGLRLHSGEYMRLCRLIRDRQIHFQVVREGGLQRSGGAGVLEGQAAAAGLLTDPAAPAHGPAPKGAA